MKVEIETNIDLAFLANKKAEQLQILSNVMNAGVLELFSNIAKKANTPEKIKAFNKKVLDNKLTIQLLF